MLDWKKLRTQLMKPFRLIRQITTEYNAGLSTAQ